jgi:cell division septal protein FtsQ
MKKTIALLLGSSLIFVHHTQLYTHVIPQTTPSIIIYGTRYVSGQAIQSDLADISIWEADLTQIESKLLKKYPYIDSLYMKRCFPNILYIYVNEHRFLGRNQGNLITVSNKVIKSHNISEFAYLPEIQGDLDSADIKKIMKMLQICKFTPITIIHKKYGGWMLVTEQCNLDIGESNPIADLKLFNKWVGSNIAKNICIRAPCIFK